MIVVRVELWSAITRQKTELGRIHISNSGKGSNTLGDYQGTSFVGRSTEALDNEVPSRAGNVVKYPRLRLHIWNLVARMLADMGYK